MVAYGVHCPASSNIDQPQALILNGCGTHGERAAGTLLLSTSQIIHAGGEHLILESSAEASRDGKNHF